MTVSTGKGALRIGVAGALGRMGRAILAAASQDPRVRVAAGWERPGHALLGQDLGTAAGLKALDVRLSAAPMYNGLDAIIDFTAPEPSLKLLAGLAKAGASPALVLGTTGFEARQQAKVQAAAKRLRIVQSSNFSVGVNLLWRALDLVARVTGDDYDVEVIEAHHHHKKDSPSGTAMTTAQVLAKALHRDLASWARYGRPKGNIGARAPKEIGLHTVRGGDIVGDHTVLFAGPGERLELKHQAHSRENFARGSLRAALWLKSAGRKPGLYSMSQVLGFER